jgi:hypothetical protein
MLEKFYEPILTILKTYTINNKESNESIFKTLQNDYKLLEKKILKHKQYNNNNENFGIKYLNETFLFIPFDDLDSNYKLYVIIKKKIDNECILLFVKKDTKTAYINVLTSYENKISHMIITNNGIHMFKIALLLLGKYKKSLNIKKIIVTDNNFIYSLPTKHNIKLSELYILSNGETFYSKLGFKQLNNNEQNKNKEILENLKVKDSYLLYYIKKYNEKNEIKELLDLVNKNNDENFIKFFNKISKKKNFEKNCEVLNYIIPKIFLKLKLYSQFNQQYYHDFT